MTGPNDDDPGQQAESLDISLRREPMPETETHLMPSPCANCSVRGLTICAPLNARELESLVALSSTMTLAPHDSIFDEDEPAEHVFNVTRGTVKLYKLLADGRRQITGFLFPGDFLGLAVAGMDRYVYTAEAVTEVELCRFKRHQMQSLLEELPKMEKQLLSMAAHELAVAQDQMLLLGRKTAREKIATFLLQLSDRAENRGQPANPVVMPMNRSDIADYLGLTTETVSRTFSQFRQAGVITLLQGGRVDLTDREELEDMAEGL